MSSAQWFDPENAEQVKAFVGWKQTGVWADDGTKPDGIEMHYDAERNCLELLARAYIVNFLGIN
jgi:hypothetical protein